MPVFWKDFVKKSLKTPARAHGKSFKWVTYLGEWKANMSAMSDYLSKVHDCAVRKE